ncbi:hypothetical protein OPQ81_008879 [Rhizoctonia solani]|nr:hypothetical protein OPQ81_008879 [Rhizoctonia solani]
MLRLRHSLPGQYDSSSAPALLTLPRDGTMVLAYPSFDIINILEAKSLRFLQSVNVNDAIPPMDGQVNKVQCITVDQELNLLLGSVGDRIGVWEPSSSFRNRNLFRVHSTLLHKTRVELMVSRKGLLAVVGSEEVAFYNLDTGKDLPMWSLMFVFRIDSCSKLAISPGLTRVSCIPKNANQVYIYSLENRRRIQSIPHMCRVEEIIWRGSTSTNRQ